MIHPPTSSCCRVGCWTARSSDEIVLNEESARLTGAEVGDVIELRSYAADQFDDFVGDEGAPDRGPRIDVEVVGIVRGSEDVSDTPEPHRLSARRVSRPVPGRGRDVRLRTGRSTPSAATSSPSSRDIEADTGGRPMVVENYDIVTHDRVSRAVGLEVGALWIATVIAGIAAVLVTTQAVARHIVRAAQVGDGARRDRCHSARTHPSVDPDSRRRWPSSAPAGAVAVSIALSPLFPRGLARRAETDPGCASMRRSRSLGALAVVLIALATVATVAIDDVRQARALGDRSRRRAGRRHGHQACARRQRSG